MGRAGRARRTLAWLILPAVLVGLLGLHLSRAQVPRNDPPGERSASSSNGPDAEASGTAPFPGLRELRDAPDSESPFVEPDRRRPGIPRTPEIDRLARLVGRQVGDRLRRHVDIEAYMNGRPIPPFERIAVSPETIETLLALLGSPDPALRRDAALRLSAAILRPGDLPLLRSALEREIVAAKGKASRHAALSMAYALAAQGDRSGTTALEAVLISGERGEDPVFRRETVLALGIIGDPESAAVLREVLGADADGKTRTHAAQGLGLLGGEQNRLALAEALVRDEGTEVRAWSAFAYGRAAPTDGSQAAPLWTAAIDDPEPGVRGASHFALARAGGPEATSSLVEAYGRDAETYPRIGALAGLTQRADLGARDREFLSIEGAAWLSEVAVTSEDRFAVFCSAWTLGRIPGEKAGPALVAVLESDHPDWVRNQAVRSLGRRDPEEALPALTARAARETRPAVKKTIENEIRRLEKLRDETR